MQTSYVAGQILLIFSFQTKLPKLKKVLTFNVFKVSNEDTKYINEQLFKMRKHLHYKRSMTLIIHFKVQ